MPMLHVSRPLVKTNGKKMSGHKRVVKFASRIMYHKRDMLWGRRKEYSSSLCEDGGVFGEWRDVLDEELVSKV